MTGATSPSPTSAYPAQVPRAFAVAAKEDQVEPGPDLSGQHRERSAGAMYGRLGQVYRRTGECRFGASDRLMRWRGVLLGHLYSPAAEFPLVADVAPMGVTWDREYDSVPGAVGRMYPDPVRARPAREVRCDPLDRELGRGVDYQVGRLNTGHENFVGFQTGDGGPYRELSTGDMQERVDSMRQELDRGCLGQTSLDRGAGVPADVTRLHEVLVNYLDAPHTVAHKVLDDNATHGTRAEDQYTLGCCRPNRLGTRDMRSVRPVREARMRW